MNFLDSGESIVEFLSFGYLGNVSEEKETRETFHQKGLEHTERSKLFTTITLCFSISILCLLFFISPDKKITFIMTAGAHSLLLLCPAILCPMLEINYIYGESAPLHVSKSVIDTTLSLYKSGPIFLAFILILCSAIIPALKSIELCFINLRDKNKAFKYYAQLCKLLGKWSMADVFVVAILISYFVPTGIKSKGNGYAESILKPGFYFFLAYCIITIIIHQYSWRKIKKH